MTFVPVGGLKCLSPALSKAPVTKHSEFQGGGKEPLFLLETFEVLDNGLDFPKWKAKLVHNLFSLEISDWLYIVLSVYSPLLVSSLVTDGVRLEG